MNFALSFHAHNSSSLRLVLPTFLLTVCCRFSFCSVRSRLVLGVIFTPSASNIFKSALVFSYMVNSCSAIWYIRLTTFAASSSMIRCGFFWKSSRYSFLFLMLLLPPCISSSRESAKRVMYSITDWIARKLGLKVNVEKTHITRPMKLKYLGFGFYKDSKTKEWKCRPHQD